MLDLDRLVGRPREEVEPAPHPLTLRRDLLRFERCTDDAGEIAHFFRCFEIVSHESFNAAETGVIMKAHVGGYFDLPLKRELFLRALG